MNKIPNKSKQIEFKYLDDETFILSFDKGRFYKLDKVGTDIWKLVDGKRDINEITEILYKKYDVKKTYLKKNVMEFLKRARKFSILTFKDKV